MLKHRVARANDVVATTTVNLPSIATVSRFFATSNHV